MIRLLMKFAFSGHLIPSSESKSGFSLWIHETQISNHYVFISDYSMVIGRTGTAVDEQISLSNKSRIIHLSQHITYPIDLRTLRYKDTMHRRPASVGRVSSVSFFRRLTKWLPITVYSEANWSRNVICDFARWSEGAVSHFPTEVVNCGPPHRPSIYRTYRNVLHRIVYRIPIDCRPNSFRLYTRSLNGAYFLF